jgi:hypothetical protein
MAETGIILAWAVAVLAWPQVLAARGWRTQDLHRDALAAGGVRIMSLAALLALLLVSLR